MFDKQTLTVYRAGGVAKWEQRFNSILFSELGASTSVYIDPEFLSLVQARAQGARTLRTVPPAKVSQSKFLLSIGSSLFRL
jgi:hypothetical protein